MPLYEIETDAHIIISWCDDDDSANEVAKEHYPGDRIVRVTRRPRDTWVISKAALGLSKAKADSSTDICSIARDCLNRSSGDKVQAIRLYMNETGSDIERARRVIESNMLVGW